ncbi:MAG: HAMP domain-containing protein [Myxococcota bacterium]
MQVFSVTQRALRFGGSAPLDLNGRRFEEVTGASDAELQKLLTKSSDLWKKIVDAIEQLIVASQARSEALTQVELKNPRLMRKMKEVSRLLANRSQSGALQVVGYQGIFAERSVKEALLYDISPTQKRYESLVNSISDFEQGHELLRKGRLPKSVRGRPLRPTREIAEKLDETKWLWIDQAEALTRLANPEGGYHRAMQTVTELSPQLLDSLGHAAVRADQVVEQNVGRLETVQLVVLALGLMMAVAAIVLAARIGTSLRFLRDLSDAISRGQVDRAVPVVGVGEIKDLCRSFERMRLSLHKAMELIERSGSQRPDGSASRPPIDLP